MEQINNDGIRTFFAFFLDCFRFLAFTLVLDFFQRQCSGFGIRGWITC